MAIVFKHYPLNFHKDAMPAALASLAAMNQGRFWEYHDLLFENQKALQADKLELYAETIGLDMEKWRTDKEAQGYKDLIANDMREASRAGVRGTPSVFINGRRFQPTGGYSVEGFKAAIDKEILKK